jgi:hypothetical protein
MAAAGAAAVEEDRACAARAQEPPVLQIEQMAVLGRERFGAELAAFVDLRLLAPLHERRQTRRRRAHAP